MTAYLAVDLGTTGCRSILFDSELCQIADSYREYGLVTPRDRWVEQDAGLWWELTKETAKEAIAKSRVRPENIKGISVSSQGITLVPVDEELNPLCNAISWLDMRAQRQAEEIEKAFGQAYMYELTGKKTDAAYFLPKLLWLREERPEIYRKAWKFLMPMDFLTAKLTGSCVTDHSMASGTLLYDIKNKRWSREVLQAYDLSERSLPELRWSGERAGVLLPEAAAALGLSENCVVAVGAQDQRCASLGAGLKKGVVTISLGTAGSICKYWDEPKIEKGGGIGWSAYVNEDSWVTEGVVSTAAASLRWLRDTMFPGESYDLMNEEAEMAAKRASRLLFYPYLEGAGCPDYYEGAEGCFYGLSLASQRGDFALAVMEGIAFQIRIILEKMKAYEDVRTVVLFGGGARSPLWCQIIADVTGMKIRVPVTPEAAGAGAAILAGIATGEFSRREPPVLPCDKIYEPGIRQKELQKKYAWYREKEYRLWR